MKDQALERLFGSAAKVKVIRFFLFNSDTPYEPSDISKRTKTTPSSLRKEVLNLEKAGFLKKRVIYKKVESRKKRGKKFVKSVKSKKVNGYILNKDFYYLPALQNLLIKVPAFTEREVEKRFGGSGSIKLLIIAGVFIQDVDSALDLLLVGDRLNQGAIDRAVSKMESEIGKELTYAVFDTPEFEYRLNVHDKLIRDILDYNHQKVVNRLGV